MFFKRTVVVPILKNVNRNNAEENVFFTGEEKTCKISEVFDKRERSKKKLNVSWLGWPDKFNTWISENQLDKYK